MMRKFASWVVVVMSLVSGCEDSESSVARKKCERLVRSYCASLVECGAVDADDRRECEEESGSELECDDAVETGPNYDECMFDIEHGELCGFPATCAAVIGVPE